MCALSVAARAGPVQTRAISLSTPAWGFLPLLTVSGTAGLLLVAAANIGARVSASWVEVAFYGGLLLLVVPFGLRLLMEAPSRRERLALVVVLGFALFACKYLRDPTWWGGYDEFLHVRTANDLLAGGLFAPNSLLDVSPSYPGMELVTAAFTQISGLPLFNAAFFTLAAARLIFVLGLFLFFERASASARIAGVASLIYMTNPHFLYFDAQFAYETLALPLASVALFLIARRAHMTGAVWTGLTVIALVTIGAVVVTHHVTSAVLAGFLVLWGAVSVVLGRRQTEASAKPGRIGFVTFVLIAGWTLTVATATIGYLGPVLSRTTVELLRLTGGQLGARELFVSRAGDVAPLWERLVGSASAAIVLFLLPLGLLAVWRAYRTNSTMVALAVAASVYPLTLVARLTAVGSEVASRTPEFMYVPLSAMVALFLVRYPYRGHMRQVVGAAGLIALLTVGGVLVGTPGWARLPGPYLVSADTRSVDLEGIAAAEWTRSYLGPHNRVVADRVNRILLSAYGEQDIISTYQTGLAVRRLYLSTDILPNDRAIVRDGGIRYLLADQRLTTGLPMVGHYFDRGEEFVVGVHTEPLNPLFLSKFDNQPEVSRVFDSGNIQIYDIGALGNPQ